MQTHRKWLIVTIWIATIAFVGAGFVGWGAYSYGKKEDTIAVIKDTEVTMGNWQDSYNRLFQEYNQYFGGKLDDKTAKQLGLDRQALKQAINTAILKQFAKDNGILVTNIEIAKVVANTKYFFKDGKFDNETYKSILKREGLNPSTYEEKIKNEVLIKKILSSISLISTKTDLESIGAAALLSDKVSIKIIDSKNIKPTVTEKDIKEFWEINKDNYKSQVSYDVSYFYSPLNATVTEKELKEFYSENKNSYKGKDGKILTFEKAHDLLKKDLIAKKSKREAILNYKKLKSHKLKFNIAKNIYLTNKIISVKNMNSLIADNNILKPVLTDKGYLIAKLDKTNKPITLAYEKAKLLAKEDLIKDKKKLKLLELAQNSLKKFKGENIGFVSRMDATKIKSLTNDEANEFISGLFDSNSSKDFVLIPEMNPSKAIAFQVTEQKLLDDKKFKEMEVSIKETSNKMLNQEIIRALISSLENKYEIKTYIKDKN
jgi:peptidyl-prolyl cis-trans isomerase D